MSHACACAETRTPCDCSHLVRRPLRRSSSNRTRTLICAPRAVSGTSQIHMWSVACPAARRTHHVRTRTSQCVRLQPDRHAQRALGSTACSCWTPECNMSLPRSGARTQVRVTPGTSELELVAERPYNFKNETETSRYIHRDKSLHMYAIACSSQAESGMMMSKSRSSPDECQLVNRNLKSQLKLNFTDRKMTR
jgi:hypothetical protein